MHAIPAIPMPVLAIFTGYAPAIQATFEVICSGAGPRLAVHTVLRYTRRRMHVEQFAVAQHLGRRPDPAALRDRYEQVLTSLGLFDPQRALVVLLREAQDAWMRGIGHPDIGTYRYCFISPHTAVIHTVGGYHLPALPEGLIDGRLPAHPQLWQAPAASRRETASTGAGWRMDHDDLATLPRRYHRYAGHVWPDIDLE